MKRILLTLIIISSIGASLTARGIKLPADQNLVQAPKFIYGVNQ